jgi:hypothetical protein
VEHRIGLQELPVVARRVEREHDPRVALDVLELVVAAHVAADDLGTVKPDPDDSDLRAAVGVDCRQVGHRPILDQLAQLLR